VSSSLLYHAFGLRGYHYERTQYKGNDVIFGIRPAARRLRCSGCGSRNVILRGKSEPRAIRTLPVGSKGTLLSLEIPRVECQKCDIVRQVELGFADSRRTYSRGFERYALELSRFMTISDTAKHLKVSWDTVKDIQARFLAARYSRPKLRDIRYLGIDEICVGRGYRYLTVVLDMARGAIVFVGDGKGAKALEPFWRRLKSSRASIEAVAMDMSAAYVDAVTGNLPGVPIIFDRFHVVKLFNEKLTALRRQLQRQASEADQEVLKGTRWLLLKNPAKLDDRRNEKDRLEKALLLNKPLAAAYYLKEHLRTKLWAQPTKSEAGILLDDWIGQARALEQPIMNTLAGTLEGHREGILAWYDHRITNGPLEGMNNKVKTMQRQAYGFRDTEFFKLRILAIHEARYVLVG
jgi:transposase